MIEQKKTVEGVSYGGEDDEFALIASDDKGIYIWQMSDMNNQEENDAKPLRILRGHRDGINAIRFCSKYSALVFCAGDGLVKLWTPNGLPDPEEFIDDDTAGGSSP